MFEVVWSWETIGAIAAIIVVLSDLIDKFWHLDGVISQARTLVVGILVSLTGYLLGAGMFAAEVVASTLGSVLPHWLGVIVVGAYASALAWFAYAQPLIKWLLELLKIRPVKTIIKYPLPPVSRSKHTK